MNFEEGNTVRIKVGAFAAFTGKVEEVKLYTGTLRVAVTIFGREQTIELPFQDVEKVAFADDSETDFSND